ncbi:MAG TPA: TonB-dependent receptor [Polyangia bacterium]
MKRSSKPRAALRAGSRLTAFALLLLSAPLASAQTNEGLTRKPAPEQTVEAGKLSKLPKQTKFVEAEYPAAAAEQNLEAEVVLLLDIDDKGQVTGAIVSEPSAHPGLGFEEAATIAAQQFEFEPAEMDGKPIAIQLAYRTKFKLAPKPPAVAPGAPGSAAAPAPAPVKNFTGTLRERGTRLPMAGIVVTIFRDVDGKPQGFEATTDGEGQFAFFDLAPGEWKIVVEAPGFYPYRTVELVAPNEAVNATYYVERGSYNPYDVTITATRPRKEVSRTIIDAKIADKIPGTSGDPLAVIQNFAGVARVPIAGLLIVRGSAPEDSRIFADGAEIPLVYHFGGLRSVFPVGMLDNIEFYPGNFSPMYGRATGGVVDVQIKKLQPPKIGGYADVSLLDSGVYLEAPVGDKAAIAIAGRRSYLDFILNAAVPDDAPVSLITAPRYYDYQVLANYRPAAAHDLRAFYFGSDDRLKLLFQNPGDIDPTVAINDVTSLTKFYRTIFTYRYVPNDRFSNDFRISQGRNRFAVAAGPLKLDVNLYTSQIRDNVRYKFGEKLTLSTGLDLLYTKFDAFVRLPLPPKEGEPPRNFDFSQVRTSDEKGVNEFYPAAFAELEYRPVPGLLLLPGVRVDRFSRTDTVVAQPRVTARWDINKQFVLKGGTGLFAQEPDIQQGEDDNEFGNPDLGPERAWHHSLGLEYKPTEAVNLDATVFYKDMFDLVSKTDATTTGSNGMPRPLVYDNGGTGRVYGLEFVARHEFTNKFTGWLAYTLSRAERRDTLGTKDRLFDFDQTHILTGVASYLLPRNWQIGGRYRLVSGNPRTPVTGGVFNASTDRYDPVFGEVNSARNPLFHQLDVRIDKRWVYQSWMWGIYMDIQNVYNQSNSEQPQYSFNYRESKPTQGLPILTILGLRAEF